MIKDRKQCRDCIYAKWSYDNRGRCNRFIWCDHLDMTGDPHKVIDGVCYSMKKTTAVRKAAELAKETAERWK